MRRLEATERQLAELSERQEQLERLPPTAESTAAYANEEASAASVEARLAQLEAAAAREPSFPIVQMGGFFHLDTGAFNQDAANLATLGDIQDGVGFRRARLQASGRVAEFTHYMFEMDFGIAGRPSFTDVWGEQKQLPFFGNLRIGQFRQPFSMDSWTSVRQIWFLERATPFQAFDPLRHVGIMAHDHSLDERTSWAYAIYRTGTFNNLPLGDTRYGTDIGDNGGFSCMGRLTHLLWYDEPANGRYLLHIGGAYNYSRNDGSTAHPVPTFQSRAIPEFFVGDPAGGGLTEVGTPVFVDTGRLASNQFQVLNAQLAAQYGPAHFQAEYFATFVDQIGNPSVFYDGAYAQFGYFLTGEHYTYQRAQGVFDKVAPFSEFFALGRDSYVCGWGAWEVAARWSYVNLNDPDAVPILVVGSTPPSPNPGRMNNLTLGLNWHWNSSTKVQFNYIHCFLDNAANGPGDCDIFCLRFQVGF